MEYLRKFKILFVFRYVFRDYFDIMKKINRESPRKQVLRPCQIRPIAFILRSGYCSGRVADRTASDLRSERPHWISPSQRLGRHASPEGLHANAGEFPVDRNRYQMTRNLDKFKAYTELSKSHGSLKQRSNIRKYHSGLFFFFDEMQ